MAKTFTKHSHLNHSGCRQMDDIQRDTQLINNNIYLLQLGCHPVAVVVRMCSALNATQLSFERSSELS